MLYGWEVMKPYADRNGERRMAGRKTERLPGELPAADRRPSPATDGDGEGQFSDQPEGWEREYRLVGLRCLVGLRYDEPEPEAEDPDPTGLFCPQKAGGGWPRGAGASLSASAGRGPVFGEERSACRLAAVGRWRLEPCEGIARLERCAYPCCSPRSP